KRQRLHEEPQRTRWPSSPPGLPPATSESTFTIDLRENRRQDTRPKRTPTFGDRYGRPLNRFAARVVRHGVDPGEALRRHAGDRRHFVQPAASRVWLAAAPAI